MTTQLGPRKISTARAHSTWKSLSAFTPVPLTSFFDRRPHHAHWDINAV